MVLSDSNNNIVLHSALLQSIWLLCLAFVESPPDIRTFCSCWMRRISMRGTFSLRPPYVVSQ